MTHFLACANEGISASKCADMDFQSSGNDLLSGFDFGTNTGLALDLRRISSPAELAEQYPQIAQEVFPTDQLGNIIAYRPGETVTTTTKVTTFREQVPVIVEQGLTEEQITKTLSVIDELKKRISNISTNQKLAGAGIGIGLLRIL